MLHIKQQCTSSSPLFLSFFRDLNGESWGVVCFQVCDDVPAVRKQLHRASETASMQDSVLTDYTSVDHVTTDAGLGSHISPPHREEQTVP